MGFTYRTERIFLDFGGDARNPDSQMQFMARELLRYADLGIDDVEVHTPDGENGRAYLRLIHRTESHRQAFEREEESDGTLAWLQLIGPVLRALQLGQIMVLDEIDSSLHPQLSARLIELFQSPETNPRAAQLIFSTHDASLLNTLNRDEVWLTEKGTDGATRLTALAEFGGDKVRRSLNLERAYMQGRFGAVPHFDATTLKAALSSRSGVDEIESFNSRTFVDLDVDIDEQNDLGSNDGE